MSKTIKDKDKDKDKENVQNQSKSKIVKKSSYSKKKNLKKIFLMELHMYSQHLITL